MARRCGSEVAVGEPLGCGPLALEAEPLAALALAGTRAVRGAVGIGAAVRAQLGVVAGGAALGLLPSVLGGVAQRRRVMADPRRALVVGLRRRPALLGRVEDEERHEAAH